MCLCQESNPGCGPFIQNLKAIAAASSGWRLFTVGLIIKFALIYHTGTEVSTCQRAPCSSNHSRASSLAEETSNGYVPMAPVDDGYVDMEPGQRYHGEGEQEENMKITILRDIVW